MTWIPATHSDQTDLAKTAPTALFDDEHKPFEFTLDAQDQLFAAAARRCTRSHGEQITWLEDDNV